MATRRDKLARKRVKRQPKRVKVKKPKAKAHRPKVRYATLARRHKGGSASPVKPLREKKKPKPAKRHRVQPKTKVRAAKARPTKKRRIPESRARSKPKKKSTPRGGYRRGGKAPRTRKRSVGRVKVDKTFLSLRTKAFEEKKLPIATNPRRKGRVNLRGVTGKERSICIELPWENVREGWLEDAVMRAFMSMWKNFARPPTMYTRFTFTVTRVATMLHAGSPKIIRATRNRVKAWFFATGLSYSLEGVGFQLEKGIDILNSTIADARRDNPNPEFLLEFVTCIAYEVK